MKQAVYKIIRNISLLFAGCLIFFNTGCGLETILIVDSPVCNHSISDANSSPENRTQAFEERYVSFTTPTAPSSGKFMGTRIYYKIFTNQVECANQRNDIVSIASGSTGNASVDKLIGTYGFQPLRLNGKLDEDLISETNSVFYLRLTNYGSPEASGDYAYPASLRHVNSDGTPGTPYCGSFSNSIPLRILATSDKKELGFDFGRNIKYAGGDISVALPMNGNADCSITQGSSNSYYYVCLFAVSVAQDTTFTNYYSKAVYLGDVAIKSDDADN